MAISYSGLTNYGKSSLPSVESWNTNNNILRDPPRSITTRRIDKVSENSFFTQELQDSSDRIAEMITAYPRGVNPMVGVSYSGNSNGGIGRGQALLYGNRQAKLPYRVMDKGAFRPPILAPVDLLPLSRMNRNTTCINPTIYKPDYSKKIACKNESRTITDKKPKTSHKGTLFMKVETPQALDCSAALNLNTIHYSIDGSKKYMRGGEQREIYDTPYLKDSIHYSIDGSKKYMRGGEQREIYDTPYLKDFTPIEVKSNISGSRTWTLPERVSLKFRPELLSESFTAKKGLVKYADIGKTNARVQNVLRGARHTNPQSYTKTVHHNVLEKNPKKTISYTINPTCATKKMIGIEMRDLSKLSEHGINSNGAILLPTTGNSNAIPSMERANLQTRLKKRLHISQ